MSGQVLKIVEQHSCLGVVINHQLSWKPHINHVANEINWVLKSQLTHLLKRIERIKLQAVCATSIKLCFIYLRRILTIKIK